MATKRNRQRKNPGSKKSSGRKYGKAASEQVETEMHEFKRGKLKSGRSGKARLAFLRRARRRPGAKKG